jgi:hypothetical protein
MESFNVISTDAAARVMPLLKESPPKVMSCTLAAYGDLDKALDVTKGVTGGVGTLLANMGGRPAMSFGRPAPLEVGRLSLVREALPGAHGHALRPTRVLSPHPTIRKGHQSVKPMDPTTGLLTPRKVTIWYNLVVHSDGDGNDHPLVWHNAWVDLNPGGARIRYTQELALLVESPLSSPLPYIIMGQQMGVGCGKVFILNPDYTKKGHTKSISSNLAPRMLRRCPLKICVLLGHWCLVMMTLRRTRMSYLVSWL